MVYNVRDEDKLILRYTRVNEQKNLYLKVELGIIFISKYFGNCFSLIPEAKYKIARKLKNIFKCCSTIKISYI